jgi:hypothetical protein
VAGVHLLRKMGAFTYCRGFGVGLACNGRESIPCSLLIAQRLSVDYTLLRSSIPEKRPLTWATRVAPLRCVVCSHGDAVRVPSELLTTGRCSGSCSGVAYAAAWSSAGCAYGSRGVGQIYPGACASHPIFAYSPTVHYSAQSFARSSCCAITYEQLRSCAPIFHLSDRCTQLGIRGRQQ